MTSTAHPPRQQLLEPAAAAPGAGAKAALLDAARLRGAPASLGQLGSFDGATGRPGAPGAMAGSPQPLPLSGSDLGLPPELASRGVGDEALAAIRAEIAAASLVEHRTVTLTSLIDRFGTRYLERATLELSSAVEGLGAAGERRAMAVGRIAESLSLRFDATLNEVIEAAPEPFASTLQRQRRELNGAKRRIEAHAERCTELLGRRMAIIAEALSGHPDGLPPTYGRPSDAPPRLLRGVL